MNADGKFLRVVRAGDLHLHVQEEYLSLLGWVFSNHNVHLPELLGAQIIHTQLTTDVFACLRKITFVEYKGRVLDKNG